MKASFCQRLLPVLLCLVTDLVMAQDPVYLDVSISLFKHSGSSNIALTETEPSQALDPENAQEAIRLSETRYMPVMLALHLIDSGRWGAVRVTPQRDPTAELGITATILRADHERLVLQVAAIDSSGRVWFDRPFEAGVTSSTSLYGNPLLQDPFQSVYSEIRRAMELTLSDLDQAALKLLKQLSMMRYGADLAPRSFAGFVSDDSGQYSLLRLPAEDDPMLRRIAAIRDREYLFIDVVDEQFQSFFNDIKPLYDVWRSSQVEQAARNSEDANKGSHNSSDFRRGSYYALRQQYDRYAATRIEAQYQRELLAGFVNESSPTELALEESLISLTGTLEEQYAQWRQILRELFMLETGDSRTP